MSKVTPRKTVFQKHLNSFHDNTINNYDKDTELLVN